MRGMRVDDAMMIERQRILVQEIQDIFNEYIGLLAAFCPHINTFTQKDHTANQLKEQIMRLRPLRNSD